LVQSVRENESLITNNRIVHITAICAPNKNITNKILKWLSLVIADYICIYYIDS
jgi:hypothetical protein